MNFAYNLRIIKFVYEDIIILFDKFGYNEFIQKDTYDLKLRYSLKKLTNYAVIGKFDKRNGIIIYKLNKHVVDRCKEYDDKYKA